MTERQGAASGSRGARATRLASAWHAAGAGRQHVSALLAMAVMLASAACAAQTRSTASLAAYKDYMLQCAGCHRYDGTGVTRQGVPSFRDSIGLLAGLPAGRDYMIRVPGAAQSQLSNAELAAVLNWAVMTYGPHQAGAASRPFTAGEVGAARQHRFDDVARARKAVAQAIAAQGQALAPYTYGSNPPAP